MLGGSWLRSEITDTSWEKFYRPVQDETEVSVQCPAKARTEDSNAQLSPQCGWGAIVR